MKNRIIHFPNTNDLEFSSFTVKVPISLSSLLGPLYNKSRSRVSSSPPPSVKKDVLVKNMAKYNVVF